MDKGSRQISIVTLGKGMALVVRCGALATKGRRVREGCWLLPARAAGRRLPLLVCSWSVAWIEIVGLRIYFLGSDIWVDGVYALFI